MFPAQYDIPIQQTLDRGRTRFRSRRTNRFQHFQVLNFGMKGARDLLPFGKVHLLLLSGLTKAFDLLSYSLGRAKDLSSVLLDTIFVRLYCTVQLVLGKCVKSFFKVDWIQGPTRCI